MSVKLRFKAQTEQDLADLKDRVADGFKSIKKSLSLITQKIDTTMASQADFKKVLARIDAATNGVADELKALKEKIKGMGLDEATEAEIFSSLDAQASKLEGVGKDEVPATPAPIDPSAPVETAPSDPSAPVDPSAPEAPAEEIPA